MRNLFKKSLAFCLVAALALTCFVGSFSVSAENPTATVSVTAGDVEVGATEIPVTLTIESATGINEALIKVSSTLGTIAEEADVVLVTPNDNTADVEFAENATDFGSFFLSARNVPDAEGNTVLGEVTYAEIQITFTNAEGIVAGDYTVDVDIPEGKVIAASKEEEVIDLAYETVTITVEEAVVEPVEPVLDESLSFRDVVVTVDTTVNIRYRIRTNMYSAKYASVEIVAYGKEYSFDNANLYNEVDIPETLVPQTASTSTGATYLFRGISMCSLGLEINAYIKAYDADGNYVAYSPLMVSSPEELLKQNLAATTTDAGKTSITELLNMAAAAQVQFAANKAGTDLAQAVADGKLVNNGVDQTYTIAELPTLNEVNEVVWEDGIAADFVSAHKLSATVTLTQSPNIRVYVGGRDTLDVSKLSVEFTYYDPDPNVKKTVTKTVDGSTAEGAAAIGTSGKRYTIEVPGFEFHNSNQTVAAVVYYDGQKLGTVNYAIETYVATTLANASASQIAKDMSTAIAKFGVAFRLNKGIVA